MRYPPDLSLALEQDGFLRPAQVFPEGFAGPGAGRVEDPAAPGVGVASAAAEILDLPGVPLQNGAMIISDLSRIEGRRYPARRRTQNLVGGPAPIQAKNFALGYVTLDPDGGQVPWHNQEQEEVYFILEGEVEVCVGSERRVLRGGQAVFIPPRVFHQATNVGSSPARMLYCYGPAGDVAHWRQELEGTLPRAGIEAPPLPEGARPQCTAKP